MADAALTPTQNSTRNSRPWLKDHQFKPGQCGNPGGRPKGRLNITTQLEERILRTEQTTEEFFATLERLIREGNSTVLNQLWDRLEGTRTQNVSVTITPESEQRFYQPLMQCFYDVLQGVFEGRFGTLDEAFAWLETEGQRALEVRVAEGV